MKALIRNISLRLFALLAALSLLFAQGGAHAQAAYAYSQQELDQMLAPIALYPDPLLSQILMAATYPSEVVEAARWSRVRPGLSGDDAVRAAEGENWDPSVKSLLAFPQVLERMEEYLQWTQTLGNAFLHQQAQLMDTVQALRRRAAAAGNLRSDDRLHVIDSGSGLMVEPLDPRIVYVPYYDPLVVYGPWWWPAYPPVYWRPWSGYYARPGYARGIYWGPPVGISAGFFFGTFDWPRRQVRVVQVNNYYYSHSRAVNRALVANRAPGAWRHEPEHRASIVHGGVAAPQRFGAPNAAQSQGHRASPADPQRAQLRVGAHTAPRPAARPGAPADGRPGDTRAAAQTRAAAPAAPPARPTAVMQSAAAGSRFDRRRDTRVIAQPAPPAPVVQPVPAAQTAPVARPSPAAQPAPIVRPAAAAHPAPIAPPAPAARANRQSAGQAPGAQHEAQRAGGSARENRHSQAAPRQGAGANPSGRPPIGR